MTDKITGKNILLICYPFFGYDEAIRDELYKLGAEYVHLKKAEYFINSPRDDEFWTPWYRIPQHCLVGDNSRARWTEQLKEETKNIKFDVLLVIENTCFKKSFIPYLKSKNPDIKTIWFLWDTFKTQQRLHIDYIPIFDKVYSFDRDDAKKYKLEYYPNFYIHPKEDNKHIYDICFIGSTNHTATANRIEILYKINEQIKHFNLKTFFYLKYYEPIIRNPIKKIWKNEYSKDVARYKSEEFMHTEVLPLNTFNEVMRDSDIILDINHPNRQGMTINAVTAIASGKKLITTNKRIKEEFFYHPNNILIIDDGNPIIPMSFIESKPIQINLSELRLDNWLKHIINS